MIAELVPQEILHLASEDEDIRRAENNVSFRQIQEILWGNASKQGLAYIVAEQAKQSDSLSGQIQRIGLLVEKLINDVNGADGVRPDIKDLKKEIQRLALLESRVEKLEQGKFNNSEMDGLKIKADRDHEMIRSEARDGRTAILKIVADNKAEFTSLLQEFRKEYRESRRDGPVAGWVVGILGIIIAGLDLTYKLNGGHAP